MTDAVYEKYKDALRRGHVAALRERFDAALVAYAEAAEIAPERALPHISLAGILIRLRRPDEALAAYGTALERAPRDESAQTGRAEALLLLGRRVEAADALDRLADQQEADGKLTEAAATVRRALELAESRTRRKHAEGLAARIEGRAWSAPTPPAASPRTERAPAPRAPAAAAKPAPPPEPKPKAAKPAPEAKAPPAAAIEPPAVPEPPPAQAKAPAAASAPPQAAPAAPAAQASGSALAAQAEASLDAGDAATARNRLIAAALAHRAAGAIDAALDACYLALGLAPADPELHLILAELYIDRGWRGPAADKLLLLGRLIDFQRDGTIRERVCRIVADRFADDPRLVELCA